MALCVITLLSYSTCTSHCFYMYTYSVLPVVNSINENTIIAAHGLSLYPFRCFHKGLLLSKLWRLRLRTFDFIDIFSHFDHYFNCISQVSSLHYN